MGTRSLVVFEDEVGEEICVVYRQYDGKTRSKELLAFIKNKKLVNGYGNITVDQSNGIGDLIAQWICYEKGAHGDGPYNIGNVYVFPAGTRNRGEEYIYTIRPNWKDGCFDLNCYDCYKKEFFVASYY